MIAFFINLVYTFSLLKYLNVYFLEVFEYDIFEVIKYNQVIINEWTVTDIVLLEL